jgi:hypothetical protein
MRAHLGTPEVLCVSLISPSPTGSWQTLWSTGSGIRRPPKGEAESLTIISDATHGIGGHSFEVPARELILKTDRARRPRRAFRASPTNRLLSGVATEARDARVLVWWIADMLQPVRAERKYPCSKGPARWNLSMRAAAAQ